MARKAQDKGLAEIQKTLNHGLRDPSGLEGVEYAANL